MAEPKTRLTGASVAKHIAAIEDAEQRADAKTLCALMQDAADAPPEMWGESIVGFGRIMMSGAGGTANEWMKLAFAVRKKRLTLYLMGGLSAQPELLAKLGPHQRGGGCLHLRRLADVDAKVLKKLIAGSITATERMLAARTKELAERAAAKKKTAVTKKRPAAKNKAAANKKAAKKR